ncbi:MAG TPA: aspartyl protease family protein [Sediminibacterium sp.]|nr:MAG: signal protein PDZ [Sphingobacteriia bacterium 35-40-8]OZA63737.1 MAG: signal protein PDZ [Sphingobacteriia bacterium 39-39-8]HQR93359.1 aspartyl protease family protein [Sediminibacterium sp.]HQS55748.1 aspartyl protease family protein [Sediminibacterium sp.]
MNPKLLPWLLGMLCTCFQLQAQEEFVQEPAKHLTKFRFSQLSGGIILINAKLDNYPDSLNFVLDTGSGGISLDSATAAELKIPLTKTERTIRGIAGMRTVDFAYDHTLKLPGLDVPHLDFHINDYELLTSVYGVRIDGVVGFSFFRRYIVKIDYDIMQINVYTPGSLKYPRGGYLMSPNFTTLPMQNALVRDSRSINSRFIFDTGAGLCFLLSQDFVEDSTVLRKGRKIYPTQAEGLGGKKVMSLTVLKEVKLGPYKFRSVPVHIFDDEYNVTTYPTLGGIIGNDLLRRFNLIVNYPEQTIHIKPNSHMNESFDYSYTGLGIYQVDGEIKVVDVIEGSPGDKAGFQTGDIIFSIENNYSKNIQVYKNLFQNAIGRIQVVVFRERMPLVLTMNVKDIRKK